MADLRGVPAGPVDGASRLPYSLRVLPENLLRNEDGSLVTAEQIGSTQVTATEFTGTVRVDTPAEGSYYRHGGILPYVLRQMLRSDESREKVV
jgi:aconitase A